MRLIRKNWILKGKWLGEMGSKPHSNGDDFSWSLKDFFEIRILITSKNKEMIKSIIKVKIMELIIYIKLN